MLDVNCMQCSMPCTPVRIACCAPAWSTFYVPCYGGNRPCTAVACNAKEATWMHIYACHLNQMLAKVMLSWWNAFIVCKAEVKTRTQVEIILEQICELYTMLSAWSGVSSLPILNMSGQYLQDPSMTLLNYWHDWHIHLSSIIGLICCLTQHNHIHTWQSFRSGDGWRTP